MGYPVFAFPHPSHWKSSIMLLLAIEPEHKSPIGLKSRSRCR